MNDKATKRWVAKAEHDFISATALIKLRARPVYDNVCYHCQQCIEKYLKAFLVSKNVRFPKSHDLIRLLDLAVSIEGSLELIRDLITPLSDYAVDIRYPGEEPTRAEAQSAIKRMSEARKLIRNSLS